MSQGYSITFWLLVIGALLLVLSIMAMARAITNDRSLTPVRRLIAYWLPIATVVLVCAWRQRSEIALGLIFGTSVAAGSLVIGTAAAANPIGPAPVRWRRVWGFVFAAALLVFVAGFDGNLGWRDALALMLQGIVVHSLWKEGRADDSAAERAVEEVVPPAVGRLEMGGVIVAVAAAICGAWGATSGLEQLGSLTTMISSGGLAASVISATLALPMVYGVLGFSSKESSWVGVTIPVGMVLLNLCVLLPVIVLMHCMMTVGAQVESWWPPLLAEWPSKQALELNYPMATWRLDTVVLILVSLVILPAGLGKWTLSRIEGLALVIAYFVYLMVVIGTGVFIR